MQRIQWGWGWGVMLVLSQGCLEASHPELGVTDATVQGAGGSGSVLYGPQQEAGSSPLSAGPTWPAGALDATTRADGGAKGADDAKTDQGDSETGLSRALTDARHRGDGGSGTGTAAPVVNPCTGKVGAKRGKSTQSVTVGGARRSFVYYAPKNLDPNRPVPLVIVPHGYTQSGEAMYDITKYPLVADREGFVLVFPDGAPLSAGPWDVGTEVCGNGAFVPGSGDDQAFVDAMIAFASADQCIDREHIFMTGWSMGGYLSHHTGCLRDDIRAIGPHSGGTHDLRSCKGRPKPVIMFHFDPDGLIDYSCGTKARDAWIARNGCQRDRPEVKTVQGGKCEYYRGCQVNAQVAFCTFQIPSNHRGDFLAGHAWSGGSLHSYSIAETESAAELGWSFFKTYAW